MLADTPPRKINKMPAVRGEIAENASLDGINWFRTGGRAEKFCSSLRISTTFAYFLRASMPVST